MAKKKNTESEIQLTEIKFGMRRNLGNYEHTDVAFSASVAEGQSPEEILEYLKTLAVSSVGEYLANEADKKEEGVETPKAAAKTKGRKAKDEEEEEEDQDEDSDDSTDDEEDDEDDEEEEVSPKAKAKKAPAKKAAAPKKKKSKSSPYDRKNDLHKDIVGTMLDEEIPKWRKKKSLEAKSKLASKELDGEDFLDSEGNVLETFKEKFMELME